MYYVHNIIVYMVCFYNDFMCSKGIWHGGLLSPYHSMCDCVYLYEFFRVVQGHFWSEMKPGKAHMKTFSSPHDVGCVVLIVTSDEIPSRIDDKDVLSFLNAIFDV